MGESEGIIIAAFVGGALSLFSLSVAKKLQDRQFKENRRLSWLDRQLEELYGPLAAKVHRLKINHDVGNSPFGAKTFTNTEENKKEWVEGHYNLYIDIIELLESKCHLADSELEKFLPILIKHTVHIKALLDDKTTFTEVSKEITKTLEDRKPFVHHVLKEKNELAKLRYELNDQTGINPKVQKLTQSVKTVISKVKQYIP